MTNPTPTDRAKALVSRLHDQGGMVSADPAALEQMIRNEIQAESNAQLMRCRERNGQVNLKVKKMHPDAIMPTRAYGQAAAFDLYTPVDVEVEKNDVVRVPVGLALEIPVGHFAKLETRSSMAFHKGIIVVGGVIDSDYRGEVHVVLNNTDSDKHLIYAGDRIAQMLILPVFAGGIEEAKDLTPTERGDKGFGSTGR